MKNNRIRNAKKKGKQAYFWNDKSLKEISAWTPEDFIEVFSDQVVLDKFKKCNDYKVLITIFPMLPVKVQETLCSDEEFVNKMLHCNGSGIDRLLKRLTYNAYLNEEEVEQEKGEGFCFSNERASGLIKFVKGIKSKSILDNLIYNRVFQLIMIFCHEPLISVYNRINVRELFDVTIVAPYFEQINYKYKRDWLIRINAHTEELLVLDDLPKLFNGKVMGSEAERKRTIPYFLNGKALALRNQNKAMSLSLESLEKIALEDLSALDRWESVDTQEFYVYLYQIIYNMHSRGELFDNPYIKGILTSGYNMGNDYNGRLISLSGNVLNSNYNKKIFSIVRDIMYLNPEDKKIFLDFYYEFFFKDKDIFDEEEKAMIYIAMESILLTNFNYNFISPSNSVVKTIMYLKFNKYIHNVQYLEDETISVHQLLRLNTKHVGKIFKLLDATRTDEEAQLYAEAIKLYFVFGIERTLDILSGKYGSVCSEFYDNLLRLDISKVEMVSDGSKFKPVIDRRFLNFLFSNNKTIEKMFNKESVMSTHWYYLYNNFDEISRRCRDYLTTKDAINILLDVEAREQRNELPLDAYKLKNILFELSLGNRSGKKDSEVLNRVIELYYQQEKRVYSSIPYVKGTASNGFSYEVMELHSEMIYAIGYKAKCCYRVYDIGNNHLEHSLLCENGRVLVTYDENGELASFTPLKRNGELLIGNSIEDIKRDNRIVDATLEGLKAIVDATKDSEERLKLVCMGSGGYYRINSEPWPKSIKTPTILEKDNERYCNTDCYHLMLEIVYKEKDLDLNKVKYGPVNVRYSDPRKPIVTFVNGEADDEELAHIVQKIDKVRYRKYRESIDSSEFVLTNRESIAYVFCSDDWYIAILHDGTFDYNYLSDDSRTLKEMKAVVDVIKQYQKSTDDIRKLALQYREKGLK